MDKLDTQLATILQDIKSPTLDALRAGVVADGVGSLLLGLVFLGFGIAVTTVLLRTTRSDFRFLWFKGPYDEADLGAIRGIISLVIVVVFLLLTMTLFNTNTWMNIFYPDAKIAERILTRR